MTVRLHAALAASILTTSLAAQDEEFRPIRVGDPDALAYTAELFPGADHDAQVPRPEDVLGQPLGSRAARHAEVVLYLERLAAASPRVRLEHHGLTFEGRALVHAIVTSPANHARLDEIRADLGRLADPRGADDSALEPIVAASPAVAWMAYSIHGDEVSGCDGALALAHHLAASQSAETVELLDRVVVVIDPLMNPDGRERFLAMVAQNAGYAPALNDYGMARGRWPFGRGNHYMFDLNRDWMTGTCPETRGRWRAVRSFRPQLLVDGHEMGSLDTYLFSPPSEPIHHHLRYDTESWPSVFARDQADAFDRHGWSYYTREWFESWGPFFSDSWIGFSGAVGILYEQAGIASQPIRRASGEVLTYRETVHHQAVSSLANLRTLAQNREAILRDYLAHARAELSPETPGKDRMFVLVPGRNRDREDRFLRALSGQGIECRRARSAFEGAAVVSALAQREETREFPAGSIVVSMRQPHGSLAAAYLELDPRFESEVVLKERRDLEQKNESHVYDVTAWSLAHAYDLDAYWCDHADVEGEVTGSLPERPSGAGAEPGVRDARGEVAAASQPPYGWAVDGSDDASVAFAAHALEAGLAVHLSDHPFTAGGRTFPRGSLLVRRVENPHADLEIRIHRAAEEADVRATALATALSPDEGPDLGGGHFQLLERPRVGLVGNAPFASDAYGHLWYLLDAELGQRLTLVDAQALGSYDLRQFNVLVLPPARGSFDDILRNHREDLETWVRSGGTLIAMEGSAAALARAETGLSSVRLRRDVLEELDQYRYPAWRERAAREVAVDPERLWGDPRAPRETAAADDPDAGAEDTTEATADDPPAPLEDAPTEGSILDGPAHPDPEAHDRWLRRFAPRGVFLRGHVDPHAWITAGAEGEMPVFFRGTWAFLPPASVSAPVRLARAERLRLAGLVWPEAVERIAESAYLTVERAGRGQVILFASTPGYRALFRGTGRLFLNAVVYGPGAGADPPLGW